MSNLIDFAALLDWVAAHPTWSGMAVCLVSISESLAIVGLFIPGTIVMFGIGALVAAGSMELGATLAWAAAGAVVGDGASYWLGRHYHQQLRVMWPFRTHPQLMSRGVEFFHHHGGKSIFFGRFMGPVRPIIPAVAGMLDMNPWRFTTVNVLSAIAWAPAYILPGVVFGASLGLAKEVASRLAVLVVLVVGVLWLTLWLVRRIVLFLQPRAGVLLDRLMVWSRRHPWLGRLSAALVDPTYPESRGLLVLAALLVTAAWGAFTLLSGASGAAAGPGPLDNTAYHVFQGLRTPWADSVMVFLKKLGDVQVYLPVAAAVLLWLALRRKTAAALHWLAAVAFGVLLVQALTYALPAPPPVQHYGGSAAVLSPLNHEIMSLMVYGFLAVLVVKEVPLPLRWIPYAAAAALVVPIALARLYLGLNWLSETTGGMALGIVWIGLLGIAYRRHAPPSLSLRGLGLAAAVVLTLAAGWHTFRHQGDDLQRYTAQRGVRVLEAQSWWEQGWMALPAYRIDLRGRPSHPLTLQWAGPVGPLRERLLASGWRVPTDLSLANGLRWLTPEPHLAELPMLPVAHDGRHESLVLTLPGDTPDRRYVLRLWPANVRLGADGNEVYIGNVSEQYLVQSLPLFSFPRTGTDFETPLQRLREQLPALDGRLVRRPLVNRPASSLSALWSGDTLLLRPPADCKECAARALR